MNFHKRTLFQARKIQEIEKALVVLQPMKANSFYSLTLLLSLWLENCNRPECQLASASSRRGNGLFLCNWQGCLARRLAQTDIPHPRLAESAFSGFSTV